MKKHFAIAILLILGFAVSISTVLAETPITQSFDTIGGIVTFGRYEQDGNEENGPEKIKWIVLDVQDGKVLLLSKYGLEVKPYNTELLEITWETCSLRAWLNDDFLNEAFSAGEQSAILTTKVDNSDAQGYSGWSRYGEKNTQDKIFLLSYAEANRYLGVKLYNEDEDDDGIDTKSRVAPTEYAIKNGAWIIDEYKTADGQLTGWWWLRSPGGYQDCTANVYGDGHLSYTYVYADRTCVRPAFWLDLNAADEKDGDTTVKIHGVVYYNTKKVIPVEPDESTIVNEEVPINGSMTDKKATAYAFINDEQSDDTLVCLIDGEWYQFLATERAGQP